MLTADMQASCSYSSTLHEASHSIAFCPRTFSRRQHPLQSVPCKLTSTRQKRDRARSLLCRADSEGSSEAARWLRQLETGQKIGSEYGEVISISVGAILNYCTTQLLSKVLSLSFCAGIHTIQMLRRASQARRRHTQRAATNKGSCEDENVHEA